MADVKIGLNQTNKPAPLGWRRFMNLYIVVVMPAVTVFTTTYGFSPEVQAKLTAVLIFTGTVVKGLGMVLGNGQIYSPSNQTIENQTKN